MLLGEGQSHCWPILRVRFPESEANGVYWWFGELDEKREDHGNEVVVLFAFEGVVGDHGAEHGSEEVFHEALFDGESLLDQKFEAGHEHLGLAWRKCIEVIGERGVEPQLVGLHEVGDAENDVEVDALLGVLAYHVQQQLPQTLGNALPKGGLLEPRLKRIE